LKTNRRFPQHRPRQACQHPRPPLLVVGRSHLDTSRCRTGSRRLRLQRHPAVG
jgi:hypothetical protein